MKRARAGLVLTLGPALGLATGCLGDDPDADLDPETDTDVTVAELALSCTDGVAQAGELCPGDAFRIVNTAALRAVTVVDFNNDGRLDIAAVSATRVYLKPQTATGWGLTSTFLVGVADFRDIAVGDFDNDADRDLVVTDFANDRVLVFYNTGVTTLPVPTAFPVGNGPTKVLAQNIDAGPAADVITLDSLAFTATVRIGAILAPVAYPIGNAPDIALVRCDAGNWPDLVYSNGAGAGHGVFSRAGNAAGAFAAQVFTGLPLPGVDHPLAIGGGLFDGDGFGDIVVTADASRVVPAHSNGNCTFTAEATSTTWAYSLQPDIRDIDTDGRLDLIAPHGNAAVSTVFGDGSGAFPTGSAVLLNELYAAAPPNVVDIEPADITGDGQLDFVVASDTGIDLWRGDR